MNGEIKCKQVQQEKKGGIKWLKSPFGKRIKTGKAKLCCADIIFRDTWKGRNGT